MPGGAAPTMPGFSGACAWYNPSPEGDAAVPWNDPDIGIRWPIPEPRLSPKDAAAPRLRDIDPNHLSEFTETGR
jgi:hypothetical protein